MTKHGNLGYDGESRPHGGVGTGDATNAPGPLNDTTPSQGTVMPSDTIVSHGRAPVRNIHPVDAARAARETASRAYLCAVAASREVGEPLDELRQDADAVASAARQVLA